MTVKMRTDKIKRSYKRKGFAQTSRQHMKFILSKRDASTRVVIA
jgi:hypothetical protein